MKIAILKNIDEWDLCRGVALITQGKVCDNKGITSDWKFKILKSEHSPIRCLTLAWVWYDLPYWVSTHLVRHKNGIEHFVKSQRSDITGIERENLPQNSLVDHACFANAQAIINISRKRLCNKASKETREAWELLINSLKTIEPELYKLCVPECVYRNGECPEFKSCKEK